MLGARLCSPPLVQNITSAIRGVQPQELIVAPDPGCPCLNTRAPLATLIATVPLVPRTDPAVFKVFQNAPGMFATKFQKFQALKSHSKPRDKKFGVSGIRVRYRFSLYRAKAFAFVAIHINIININNTTYSFSTLLINAFRLR